MELLYKQEDLQIGVKCKDEKEFILLLDFLVKLGLDKDRLVKMLDEVVMEDVTISPIASKMIKSKIKNL